MAGPRLELESLSVKIIGDNRQFIKTLRHTQAAAKNLASKLGQTLGGGGPGAGAGGGGRGGPGGFGGRNVFGGGPGPGGGPGGRKPPTAGWQELDRKHAAAEDTKKKALSNEARAYLNVEQKRAAAKAAATESQKKKDAKAVDEMNKIHDRMDKRRETREQNLLNSRVKGMTMVGEKEAKESAKTEGFKQKLKDNSARLATRQAEQQAKKEQQLAARTVRQRQVEENKAARMQKMEQNQEAQAAKEGGMALKQAALAAAVGIGAIGTASVMAFGKFDLGIKEAAAIMDKVTDEQIAEMEKAALDLGSKGIHGPAELAKSFYYMGSAGISAKDSVQALSVIQQFATAGAMDLAKATDFATGTQTALGLRSEDSAKNIANLSRVTDVLVAISAKAQGTTEQFAEAMETDAAATARIYGKSLEEVAATLGVYGMAGIKGRLAGGMFARSLRMLSNAAVTNDKAHKALGFSLFDNTGKMKSMVGIVENLEQVLGDLSPQGKAKALEALGIEALQQKALLPLIGMSKQIKKFQDQMIDAGGTAKSVAGKQMEAFNNKMLVMKNLVETVAISIGRELSPAVLMMADGIKGMSTMWNALPKGIKTTIILFGVATGAIAAMTVAAIVLMKVINLTFGGIPLIMGALITGVAALSAGLGYAAFKMGGIAEVMEYIRKKGEQAWEWLKPVRAALSSLFGTLVTVGVSAMKRLEDAVSSAASSMRDRFGVDMNKVRDNIVKAIYMAEFVLLNFGMVWDIVTARAREFKDTVVSFFTDTIPAALNYFLNNWRDIFDTAINIGRTLLSSIWSGGAMSSGLSTLKSVWSTIWSEAFSYLRMGFDLWVKYVPTAMRQVLSYVLSLWVSQWTRSFETIGGLLRYFADNLPQILGMAFDNIVGYWKTVWKIMGAVALIAGTLMWESIKTTWSVVIPAVFDLLVTLARGVFTQVLPGLLNVWWAVIKMTFGAVVDLWKWTWGTYIPSVFMFFVNNILSLWQWVWGTAIPASLQAWFSVFTTVIGGAFDIMAFVFKDGPKKLAAYFRNYDWKGMWDGLKSSARSAMEHIMERMKKARTATYNVMTGKVLFDKIWPKEAAAEAVDDVDAPAAAQSLEDKIREITDKLPKLNLFGNRGGDNFMGPMPQSEMEKGIDNFRDAFSNFMKSKNAGDPIEEGVFMSRKEKLKEEATKTGEEVGKDIAVGIGSQASKVDSVLRFSSDALQRIQDYTDRLRGDGPTKGGKGLPTKVDHKFPGEKTKMTPSERYAKDQLDALNQGNKLMEDLIKKTDGGGVNISGF